MVQVDKTAETSEPNLENTYLKISLCLEDPFLQASDGIVAEKLISDPPEVQPPSEKVQVVHELED